MKKILLNLIKLYQNTRFFHLAIFHSLFMTDKICRFTPTCSEYTYEAVNRYGVGKGVLLGLKRIVRCHPFTKGGYDPVK